MQKLSLEGFSLQAGLLLLLSSQLQEECGYALQTAQKSCLNELNLPPTASPRTSYFFIVTQNLLDLFFSSAEEAKTGSPYPKAPSPVYIFHEGKHQVPATFVLTVDCWQYLLENAKGSGCPRTVL